MEVRCGSFPMAANGRALAKERPMVVAADAHTDRLLGVQIVARGASELIVIVAHMEYGGSAEDLARTIHAHLVSESPAAALSSDGLHSF